MPFSLQLALVLPCKLQQVPQMLSAVTQTMPKLQGMRGVHHVPCSSGQGRTRMVYIYSKTSSCGKQVAGVRGDGILLGLLPAQDWDQLKQCIQTWEPRNFLRFHSGRLELVVLHNSGGFRTCCSTNLPPTPWYPTAGFDACMMWSQYLYESLCVSGGKEGGGDVCNIPAVPVHHQSTVCG